MRARLGSTADDQYAGKEVGRTGTVKGGGVWGITSPGEIEAVLRDLDQTETSHDQD